MKTISLFFALLCLPDMVQAQGNYVNITGTVLDATTKEPLAYATIGIQHHVIQTVSNSNGGFEIAIPPELGNDSLFVSYLGYKTFTKKISDLKRMENIYLVESAIVLKEIVVSYHKFNLRDLNKSMKRIKGNLYALETEVTNGQYNAF